MNLSLVDPFVLAQDCPEILTGSLRNGHSAYVRFSHRGDMLASGRLSGVIVIFDIETHGVACKLRGHTRQIQSLCWSASDRYLLSASLDWKAILWDLKTGQKIRSVRFEAPVFIAQLHPKNHLQFVVALFEDQPRLVNMRSKDPQSQVLPSIPIRNAGEADGKNAKMDAKNMTTVAVFSPGGRYIFAGTNKGWLNIISSATGKIVHSFRISSSIAIMIRFSPSGRSLLVNSSDRIIRTFTIPFDVDSIPDPTIVRDGGAGDDAKTTNPVAPSASTATTAELASTSTTPFALQPPSSPSTSSPFRAWESFHLELEHKFQDIVSRMSWNHVGYSATGEYMLASTWMNHTIYIWERSLGTLVKILEGPKEEFSVVEWHPHRPFIAAVGVDSGNVYFWSVPTPQRWSALAPDFVEVEENIEYVEQEDEFDIRPQEELEQRRLDAEDDEVVDVLTLGEVGGGVNRAGGGFFGPGGGLKGRRRKRRKERRRSGDGCDGKVADSGEGHRADTDVAMAQESDHGDIETETDESSDGEDDDDDDDDGISDPEFQMPVWLDVDCADSEDEVVAVGAGQFRRKSPTAASSTPAATAAAGTDHKGVSFPIDSGGEVEVDGPARGAGTPGTAGSVNGNVSGSLEDQVNGNGGGSRKRVRRQ